MDNYLGKKDCIFSHWGEKHCHLLVLDIWVIYHVDLCIWLLSPRAAVSCKKDLFYKCSHLETAVVTRRVLAFLCRADLGEWMEVREQLGLK